MGLHGKTQERENIFMEHFGGGTDTTNNDLNRSLSTPVLLRKHLNKRLEKINHPTNKLPAEEEDREIEGQESDSLFLNNRYDKQAFLKA